MTDNCKQFNILITCIGRRVSLLKAFKKAAKSLKINAKIIGTDKTSLSSALQLCDEKFIVKKVDHKDYVKQLLQIVKKYKVKLLVPTVDLDLQVLAENKNKFAKAGCIVLISELPVVKICQDKRLFAKFIRDSGFDTPQTFTPAQAIAKKNLKYPLFLKPWDGYASRGNAIANNRQELLFYTKKIPNCIVQEFIKGQEITCDCLIDFDMKVRCVVPRKRLETRAGEVSKSKITKNKHIMRQTVKMLEKLGAGAGVITVQMILTADNKIKFIEANPRFGGGVPLSIKAGADFPKWIIALLTNKNVKIAADSFEDNLLMLRYDAEVWLKNHGE